MVRGKAPVHIDRAGYHLHFESVPAWVCSQCGESFFDETQVESIQEAVRALDGHARTLELPV
jgi:YgiT-type zinc finger domain-containing protein